MVAELVAALSSITGVSFASFVYKTKGTGEVAKYLVILGASTENMYEKDVPVLERYVRTLKGIKAGADTIKAAEELLASRVESLTKGVGNNSAYTCADTYTPIKNLPGVKIHNETGELYVTGLLQDKTVLVPGTYKVVKSSAKTLAKRKIEKHLPSAKRFRQFSLDGVTAAKVRGQTLEFEAAA